MSVISKLWRERVREKFGSMEWLRIWAKRAFQIPQYVRYVRNVRSLSRQGSVIHDNVFLTDISRFAGNLRLLSIDSETFIGRAQIEVHDSVIIGQRVCINDDVRLLTASHNVTAFNWQSTHAPIKIDDYAWIATGAIILPGVHIGRGAVVGAAAVVAHDVQSGCVVVGNPARVLSRQRSENLEYSPLNGLALFSAWKGKVPANTTNNTETP